MQLASPLYAHKASALSDADAVLFGQNYDLAVSNPNQLSGKDALVRSEGAEALRYTKTNQEKDGSHPDALYSHRTDGSVRKDPNWNVYCMEPSNADWRKYHEAELKSICASANVDGIFSDSAGLFSLTQGGNHAGKPPGWKTPYSSSEWLALIHTNLVGWASAVAPKQFIINGLDQHTVDLYDPTVGLIEGAYNSKSGSLPDATRWATQSQFILDAQSKGWTPWVWIKLFHDTYATQADKWRRCIVPTMYLVDNGALLFDLSPSEGGAPAWDTKEYTHACYHADIGVPLDYVATLGELAHGNVYVRQYTKGFVVYNPTPLTTTVVVNGVSFSVTAQSGNIYKASTSYTFVA